MFDLLYFHISPKNNCLICQLGAGRRSGHVEVHSKVGRVQCDCIRHEERGHWSRTLPLKKVDQHVSRKFDKQSIIGQVTVYAEKESGEVLDHVDNVHWVYGRKISEQKIAKNMER